MRWLTTLVLLALLSGGALAQTANDGEMRRLTALLDAIRQEQQSVFQQFQMTESLQRSELREVDAGPSMSLPDGKAPSYDDAVRSKQDRQTRLKYYADEMQRLSKRYAELGNQAAALVEEMRALAKPGRP